ncbi:hypothetical protein Y032_0002g635 [Ancylostoma ceylanicum]|uniref:Uncharacterized protein n=1 Tax=Ancylostoma ceylanicum TaxID=53326 RepID=A0A016W0Q6_9BILA|nr:hypothetical protein Y032_0002g635 [Ancylostoma ceylanicum]
MCSKFPAGNTSFTSSSAFSNGGATSTFSGGSTAFGSQPYGYTAAQQPTIKFNPMSGLGNQEVPVSFFFIGEGRCVMRSKGMCGDDRKDCVGHSLLPHNVCKKEGWGSTTSVS